MAANMISGDRHLDGADLQGASARAASGFASFGLRAGDMVALLLRNDFAFLIATVGAQRAACYPVPINWHCKGDEVRYVLDDCGARLLIGHADLIAAVRDSLPEGLRILSVETPPEVAAAFRVPDCVRLPDTRDTAWTDWLAACSNEAGTSTSTGPARESIIYTSGTTGRPKGVRRGVPDAASSERIERMRAAIYGFRPGMRTAITAPMYHSAPNSYALRALRYAELVVLLPRFEPEALLRLVQEHRLTHLFMVPTMFVRLLKLPEEVRARYDVSSLVWIIHAGAPCPPDVKKAMIAWLGPVIHEFYGGTESGSVTYCDSRDALLKPGTVGRTVDGARIEIVRDDGTRAGVGEAGEIFMRIEYFPDFTYVGRDDLRREIDRGGLITCGDVGYLDDDGYLFICDRKRDMVIVGGVNIYPAEIESVLTGMIGVRDCAVFGIPHAEYGEELMAVVQPVEGAIVQADEVRCYLAERLADYKVPRRIDFRSDLPREDSGKIFKRRLRDPYWAGQSRAV